MSVKPLWLFAASIFSASMAASQTNDPCGNATIRVLETRVAEREAKGKSATRDRTCLARAWLAEAHLGPIARADAAIGVLDRLGPEAWNLERHRLGLAAMAALAVDPRLSGDRRRREEVANGVSAHLAAVCDLTTAAGDSAPCISALADVVLVPAIRAPGFALLDVPSFRQTFGDLARARLDTPAARAAAAVVVERYALQPLIERLPVDPVGVLLEWRADTLLRSKTGAQRCASLNQALDALRIADRGAGLDARLTIATVLLTEVGDIKSSLAELSDQRAGQDVNCVSPEEAIEALMQRSERLARAPGARHSPAFSAFNAAYDRGRPFFVSQLMFAGDMGRALAEARRMNDREGAYRPELGLLRYAMMLIESDPEAPALVGLINETFRNAMRRGVRCQAPADDHRAFLSVLSSLYDEMVAEQVTEGLAPQIRACLAEAAGSGEPAAGTQTPNPHGR